MTENGHNGCTALDPGVFDPPKDDRREDGLSIDGGGNIDDAGVNEISLSQTSFPIVCSLAILSTSLVID